MKIQETALSLIQYSKEPTKKISSKSAELIKEIATPVLRNLGGLFFKNVMSINNVPASFGRESIREFLLSGVVEGSPIGRTPESDSDLEV